MHETVEVKVTIRRKRKVVAIISDAEMAIRVLSDSHPEIAKLFVALDHDVRASQAVSE